MKYFIIFLLAQAAYADFFSGPHGDGKFLANPQYATLSPCAAGEYNSLELAANGTLLNWDGSTYVTQCKVCDKTVFHTAYSSVISGAQLSGLNREECCFNSDNIVCIEQRRAYEEGCHSADPTCEIKRLNDACTVGNDDCPSGSSCVDSVCTSDSQPSSDGGGGGTANQGDECFYGDSKCNGSGYECVDIQTSPMTLCTDSSSACACDYPEPSSGGSIANQGDECNYEGAECYGSGYDCLDIETSPMTLCTASSSMCACDYPDPSSGGSGASIDIFVEGLGAGGDDPDALTEAECKQWALDNGYTPYWFDPESEEGEEHYLNYPYGCVIAGQQVVYNIQYWDPSAHPSRAYCAENQKCVKKVTSGGGGCTAGGPDAPVGDQCSEGNQCLSGACNTDTCVCVDGGGGDACGSLSQQDCTNGCMWLDAASMCVTDGSGGGGGGTCSKDIDDDQCNSCVEQTTHDGCLGIMHSDGGMCCSWTGDTGNGCTTACDDFIGYGNQCISGDPCTHNNHCVSGTCNSCSCV